MDRELNRANNALFRRLSAEGRSHLFAKMTTLDAIRALERVSSVGSGPSPVQQAMLGTIEAIESQYPSTDSAELEYWLGIAWRNYNSWFVRGDSRVLTLQKAIAHFERATVLEEGGSTQRWNTYASELGTILVEEALVRDLERGIAILETVFQSTTDYEPRLCAYAEAIYKTGDYREAAEVATELHKRAKSSREWHNQPPPAPMRIAAKAYRAYIKQLRKEGRTDEALAMSRELLRTGAATENDQRNHAKLETPPKKT
jgi:tetratricopeptide (TPR) repeat protein